MVKKSIFSALVCIVFSLMILTGCSSDVAETDTNIDTNDKDIVTIKMSDEAKKYEQDVIAQDGVKQMLQENVLELLLEDLKDRGEQEFPECEVDNKLDSFECGGSKVYTLTKDDYSNVVLYIHGGAWTFGISEEHVTFCDDLASELDAKVYMPLYPLSPESNSAETYEMIEALYDDMLDEGKTLYLMGDSAGGNIALGLMHAIKQEGLTKPDKMILFAPCTDATFTNENMKEIEKTDPELTVYGAGKCAEVWAGKENLKDPKNSAMFADVTGYPDTMIFQGTNDILYADNPNFYLKMKEAGVKTKLVVGEGLFHVFPIYPIPEKEEALKLIEKFCAE